MSDNEKEEFLKKYKIISSKEGSSVRNFYYGVKTTGVFCLPGCTSRLPNRENVLFFDRAQDAIKKGYRPCKRCRPLCDSSDDQSALIIEICRLLEESDKTPTLKMIADKTGYSESYVQRLFKRKTGISPKNYAQTIKSKRFREEISNGTSISSSIYSAGFGSSSRVYENLDNILAMTPKQYQNYGEGLDIRWDVFPCFLGFVLIAFTAKGVSTVDIGGGKSELIDAFKKRFCNASLGTLTDDDREIVKLVLDKINNPGIRADIPLDIRGTVFQHQVWKALQTVPPGRTVSYSDIAEQIGQPQSVRAVANACGKNSLAILVPCHRVIRKNGDLGGYKWGLERKIRLLERERNL